MSPLSVLYVDDDRDIRTIVHLALSLDPAITLTLAESGNEALDLLAQGLTIDVAIVDMMMPEMSGCTLMQRLRDEPASASVPVIVISARTRDSDVASYRAAGAIGVIVKPFDPLRLAGEIRALVAAHRDAIQPQG